MGFFVRWYTSCRRQQKETTAQKYLRVQSIESLRSMGAEQMLEQTVEFWTVGEMWIALVLYRRCSKNETSRVRFGIVGANEERNNWFSSYRKIFAGTRIRTCIRRPIENRWILPFYVSVIRGIRVRNRGFVGLKKSFQLSVCTDTQSIFRAHQVTKQSCWWW